MKKLLLIIVQQPDWIKDINNNPYILPTIGILVIIFLIYSFLRNKKAKKIRIAKEREEWINSIKEKINKLEFDNPDFFSIILVIG